MRRQLDLEVQFSPQQCEHALRPPSDLAAKLLQSFRLEGLLFRGYRILSVPGSRHADPRAVLSAALPPPGLSSGG